MAPIRFFLNNDLLLNANADTGKTCYAAGDVVDLGPGKGTKPCLQQHVLTPQLGQFLANSVLPAIIEIFNTLLTTVPVTGNIKLNPGECQRVTIPNAYTTNGVGVPNTDYIMFSTGRPAPDDHVVASAGFCQQLGMGKPIAGNINFNPYQFGQYVTNAGGVNMWSFAGAVKVGVHEMTHALGFTPSLYPFYTYANTTSQTLTGTSPAGNAYSQKINYLTGPTISAKANSHFGCTTLSAIPLEEYGGHGTAGAHWEQRIVGDEYMSGFSNPVMPISILTLALFEDMGWYKANYSAAEYWGWGKDQGCAFVTNRCEEVWPNNPAYWCSAPSSTSRCSADRKGKGVCNLAQWTGLTPYYQHFSDATLGGTDGSQALDYCPSTRIFSNRY